MSHSKTICIVGGGAAGVFASIFAARADKNCRVILLEKSKVLLSKVRISGGGRCNVTHACFDPKELIQNYPRGGKALLGPFTRYQPRDVMQWFENQGVRLKIEADGRVFPTTDNSETIVNCLLSQAYDQGVEIKAVAHVETIERKDTGFSLTLSKGDTIDCDALLLATGSSAKAWEWLKALGHHIVPPLPSLFTFNVPNSPLLDLAGVSVADVHVKIKDLPLEQRGPLLITHWGFSGPAILKLSAWGARLLFEKNYCAELIVNWIPELSKEELKQALLKLKEQFPARLIYNEAACGLPKNLWKKLAEKAGIPQELRWSGVSNALLLHLMEELQAGLFAIAGKSTYKEEFVTCGGVDLTEIDFKTMESKVCPNLYFAGEIIDVDGVTGGFNFQNAWTTGWIAAHALVRM